VEKNLNLYSLPVKENGRAFSYYCLVTSVDSPTCHWVLVRGGDILSTGLVEDDDVDTMLNALRTDLNGRSEWQQRTVH
jgi:hypothetical protein